MNKEKYRLLWDLTTFAFLADPAKRPFDTKEFQRDDASDRNSNAKATETVDRNELNAKVSEKLDKIKDAIKDELDVTDEDIEDAMAVLGLMPADLLNADDLKAMT